MNREELRKLIVGPIGAVSTPFDGDLEVDLGAMHEMVQMMIDSGVCNGKGAIKIASALGEGPMLRETEWPALLRTAVNAAGGRVPVMFGIHDKDTRWAIDQAKQAHDLGAVAIQLTPPIYNIPTQQDMYDYFYDVSDATDIGIMIYHTHWMPGGSIETDTFLRMADIDNVVAVKWGGSSEGVYEDMAKFVHIFNVIDNSANPVGCAELGGHGYVQTTLDINPQHDLRVWELIQEKRYDEARILYHSVYDDISAMYEKVAKRTGGQAVVFKGLMSVMGHHTSAPRPPSKALNDEEMAELREKVASWGWTAKG